MPPTKRVIVKWGILNSEVTAGIAETLTLKLLKRRPALSDIRKVHDSKGVILQISRTVDRHLRSTKLSENGFQTFAVIDHRDLLADSVPSFVPNNGVVEVQNQNTGALRFACAVRIVRFLTSVPVGTASNVQRSQVRAVQALVLRGYETVKRYIRTS